MFVSRVAILFCALLGSIDMLFVGKYDGSMMLLSYTAPSAMLGLASKILLSASSYTSLLTFSPLTFAAGRVRTTNLYLTTSPIDQDRVLQEDPGRMSTCVA